MIEAGLCFCGLDAATDEAAIRALARALLSAGKVTASFESAALLREKRFPTGLPLPGGAIAIPHADPEHVKSPALAVAKLAAPVAFREMGNPASQLDVALVVMPALTAKDQAAAGLARILDLLKEEALRAELRAAADAVAIFDAFKRRWELP